MGNPKFTEFSRIGPSALSTIEAGPDGFKTFGNHRVYITNNLETDASTGPLDLLKRRVVMGEYYVMYALFSFFPER